MTITTAHLSPTEVLNLESTLSLIAGVLEEMDEAHGRGDVGRSNDYVLGLSCLVATLAYLPGGTTDDLAGLAGMAPTRIGYDGRRWVLDLDGSVGRRVQS